MIKIAFPEYDNPIIKQAVSEVDGIEPISCEDLTAAAAAVKAGVADTLVAGINYTSRDVILACRDIIGMSEKTFSASFWMKDEQNRQDEISHEFVVGDAAACKNPTQSQLLDIVLQTHQTAKKLLSDKPRVAILSFSTLGSGGMDPSIERAKAVVEKIHTMYPDILIDGELQLDAAINPRVAEKKLVGRESEITGKGGSAVAGHANVLIAPDLNSGNILYKAMEQFGGMTAAGPILQGFKAPASDLSRGSTVSDVKLVLEAMKKL